MKHRQGGVRLSVIVLSVVFMGTTAWFSQAQAATQSTVYQQTK